MDSYIGWFELLVTTKREWAKPHGVRHFFFTFVFVTKLIKQFPKTNIFFADYAAKHYIRKRHDSAFYFLIGKHRLIKNRIFL